jgi:hypothetical protein
MKQTAISAKTARWKLAGTLVLAGSMALASSQARATDLGAAKQFAILSSSSDVSMKNRVHVNAVGVTNTGSCPGSVGCPGSIGGTTILMGRGNGAAPDTVSGDAIGTATSSQGLNCANNPPGTTAICMGNDSEIAGQCITGGGEVSLPSECGLGTDTTGTSAELGTMQQAGQDAAAFSAALATLSPTQSLAAITLGTRGKLTITGGAGANVVNLPSIITGTKSTITIDAGSSETMVINVGSSSDAGSLQLGNGASVLLTGGITPDHVIFNLLGTGTTAQLGNDTVLNGTIVAPNGQFTSGDGNTPVPVLINGALLFGGSVSLGNNTNLNFYPAVVTTGGGTTGPPPTT